VSYLTGQQ
ncbi:hypothetical protein N499_0030B, partial [Wolbachia pipientis wVitA]